MNVIIANQYKEALSNLNIDVIKKMDGEFDVQTIADTFANFYFNRMIIDITALKDCFNIATIQRLSTSLDASKIILFLSDDLCDHRILSYHQANNDHNHLYDMLYRQY